MRRDSLMRVEGVLWLDPPPKRLGVGGNLKLTHADGYTAHDQKVRSSGLEMVLEYYSAVLIILLVFGWYNQYPCPIIQQCYTESPKLTVV
jgi:hypothetical protein